MKRILFAIFVSCFAFCNAVHAVLPSGYTPLQYIQNNSNTYINTGVTPDVDDIEMEILYDAVTGSNYIFQSQEVNGGPINGLSGSTNGNTINAPFNNGTTAVSSIVRTAGKRIYTKANFNNGISTLYVRDDTNNTNDTTNGSYTFAIPGAPFCLFGNTVGKRINAGAKIYYAKMKVDGDYVIDYVPAKRNSDNAIGFYDMASKTFKTATAGSFIGGPETTEYTITYVLNGGTNYANAPTSYRGGLGATIDGAPTMSNNMFVGWCTDSALTNCAGTQTISTSATGNKTFYAKFEIPKFKITTTNLNLSTNDNFRFYITATGTFYVDCGNDGTLSGLGAIGNTITRTNISTGNDGLMRCTYTTGGVKEIRMGGLATGYGDTQNSYKQAAFSFGSTGVGTAQLVAKVDGSLGAIFPTLGQSDTQQPSFNQTFRKCSNLTSIPTGLFSGVTGSGNSMFKETFSGCTGLTSIPTGLFSGVTGGATGMFHSTFYDCTGLTSIPGNLFQNISGITDYMFSNTFRGCTGLTSIPGNLFQSISGAAPSAFEATFAGCTGLTSIPGNLFRGITGTSTSTFLFGSTFANCTGLTSIPGNLFSHVSGSADHMFFQTFYGCTGLTSIPKNLFSSITGTAPYLFVGTFMNTSVSGYIPPSTFAGLIANDSPTAEGMWNNAFYGTNLNTSCPAGTEQYITGYETDWETESGRAVVSCKEPLGIASTSYVAGMYEAIDTTKQNKLTSSGQNPNIVMDPNSSPVGIISNVTANGGVMTVTRSEITIPWGGENSNNRAEIWTEL